MVDLTSRKMGPAHRAFVFLALVEAGCSASIVGDQGQGDGDDAPMADDDDLSETPREPDVAADGTVVKFGCEMDAEAEHRPLRRLGAVQYRNTLRDLIERVSDGATADQILVELRATIAEWPVDQRKAVGGSALASYARLDQTVSQQHIDTAYLVATSVGRALSDRARLGKVVGACAVDGQTDNDAACLTDFIARFGALALRRPVTDQERELYRTRFYGSDPSSNPAAYADVIAALLMAPQFLYHVEHGEELVDGLASTFALGPYELASRMSYHFWDTMPDDELFQAAASGRLASADGVTEQVDRLLADPRAAGMVETFYSDWLQLPDVPRLDAQIFEPLFKSFSGRNLPSAMLREAMIDEVVAMTRHHTLVSETSLAQLLTSDESFARSQELADIYGVPVWDGVGDPPLLPAGERPGLLTRAALHATGNAQTRPVKKGVFVRDTILCDDLPEPPPDVVAAEPELSPDSSTRQVVEAITERPGTACVGCHGTFINAIGYATENIDSLGRLRQEQILFDEEGHETTRVPIDTETVAQIIVGDMTPTRGPADLAHQIVNSGKPQACLARQMYRFTFATKEDELRDGCALERMRSAVDKGSLRSLFREAALTSAFSRRVIP